MKEMVYLIKKNGKFVKDYTEGTKLTSNYNLAEKYTSKKAAQIAAQQYGRINGAGYTVVKAF